MLILKLTLKLMLMLFHCKTLGYVHNSGSLSSRCEMWGESHDIETDSMKENCDILMGHSL